MNLKLTAIFEFELNCNLEFLSNLPSLDNIVPNSLIIQFFFHVCYQHCFFIILLLVYQYLSSVLSFLSSLHCFELSSYCTITFLFSVFCVLSLQEMQDNYTFLLSVYEKLLERLQDGVSLCDVYSFVYQFVEERRPDLKDYLTKNLG